MDRIVLKRLEPEEEGYTASAPTWREIGIFDGSWPEQSLHNALAVAPAPGRYRVIEPVSESEFGNTVDLDVAEKSEYAVSLAATATVDEREEVTA